jgi:hypothetical protein
MDGINPTLAFVALLFGLSGNARDAANDLPAGIEPDGASGCPAPMVAGNPPQPPGPETWAEEFWNTAASGSTLPDLIDPGWIASALVAIKGHQPSSDAAPVALDHGSSPLMRRIVPTATNVLAANPGSNPCQPKPLRSSR